jgi:hypothetical protein
VRAIGTLLIVCVALAVVKAAIASLLLVLIIALIWAACIHPRETFGLLIFFAVMGVVSAHPMSAIAIFGLAIVCAQLTKNDDKLP